MVPVKVKSVSQHVKPHMTESEFEDVRTRAVLTLKHPSRYSVFVAASGQTDGFHRIPSKFVFHKNMAVQENKDLFLSLLDLQVRVCVFVSQQSNNM